LAYCDVNPYQPERVAGHTPLIFNRQVRKMM